MITQYENSEIDGELYILNGTFADYNSNDGTIQKFERDYKISPTWELLESIVMRSTTIKPV